MGNRPTIEEIERLVTRIRPMLAGRRPEIIGAVFAELISTWLAGHWSPIPGDRERARHEQLDLLIEAVKNLVPMQEDHMRKQGRFPDG